MTVLHRVWLVSALLVSSALGASVHDAANGFGLRYPANWTSQKNVMGAVLAVLAPPEHQFSRNVNVVVVRVPSGATLEAIYSASLSTLHKLATDFKLVSERRLTLAGQPARELVYTSRQGQFDLRQKQRYVLSGGRLYVLTATGLRADPAADRLLDPVMDSFSLDR